MAMPPNFPTASEPPPPPPPPGQGLRALIWGILLVGAFMLISLPTVILVFFGLLPTIVAWIVDRSDKKYAMFCVFGMNFSGLFPFLMDIWFKEHSTDAAMRILTDVFDLMVIYTAAGFGWMLYIALPPVITTFLTVMSERRVTVLKENQKTIIEEWGEGVINVVETLDKDSMNNPPRI
ncbi:MAG: acyl-CoA synthetase [Alphaproteobacteria bacterium]|nr:acyl-CoA synthetase [Alphaproteobacteria bacterium]